MLTVDFDRLRVGAGSRVLDVGCGGGRHSAEALRRGAIVTAVDANPDEVAGTRGLLQAMCELGEAPAGAGFEALVGDACRLPLPDQRFDVVIASEIFEHVVDDEAAMAELSRVLKPGGRAAVSVPRRWPERICWALSADYRSSAGGHVRIYRREELTSRLTAAGLAVTRAEHAHALHSPYWWLKCAIGLKRGGALPVRAYHGFLVWGIVRRPRWLERSERALNPLLGKSLVVYLEKPIAARAAA
jgi:SAM-dependent methyltransferase